MEYFRAPRIQPRLSPHPVHVKGKDIEEMHGFLGLDAAMALWGMAVLAFSAIKHFYFDAAGSE